MRILFIVILAALAAIGSSALIDLWIDSPEINILVLMPVLCIISGMATILLKKHQQVEVNPFISITTTQPVIYYEETIEEYYYEEVVEIIEEITEETTEEYYVSNL